MSTPTFPEVFHQIRVNFQIMGIPQDKSRLTLKFYVLMVLLILMIVEESAFFVYKMAPENFLKLTGLAPCLCVGLLSVLKIVPVAMKRETVFALAYKLNDLSKEILNDTKKKNIVKKDIELLRILLKYYFILNGVLISVYNFSTPVYILYHYITTKEELHSLPYAVIVPFSTERWLPWTIVYLHSIFSGFICVIYFTSADALYLVLTSYVCSGFAVLSNEIQALAYATEETLHAIVKRHQYYLKLADDLEVIFTLPNFFNVLVGSIEICALGFNLMIGDWSDVPGCMLFLSSVLLQIYMISVFGEKLIRESTKVGDAAFFCKWYEMNERSKKIILTLMLRSHKAQRLTAYKFSVICFEGFTKIISTSWSYFTILRTVYSTEEN